MTRPTAMAPDASTSPVGQWQPIETAPRDDTVVLLAGLEGICTAQWKERRREWQIYTSDNGWQECEVWPTHWMPLPPAPEVSHVG